MACFLWRPSPCISQIWGCRWHRRISERQKWGAPALCNIRLLGSCELALVIQLLKGFHCLCPEIVGLTKHGCEMRGIGPYPIPSEVNGTPFELNHPNNDLAMSKSVTWGVYVRCVSFVYCCNSLLVYWSSLNLRWAWGGWRQEELRQKRGMYGLCKSLMNTENFRKNKLTQLHCFQ